MLCIKADIGPTRETHTSKQHLGGVLSKGMCLQEWIGIKRFE